MPDDSTQCWLFPGLFLRQVVATFDQERGSSDGGAILLKAADERLGLTRALVNCLSDVRDPDRVTHDLRELLQQRVFGIACGYPDGNDSDRLAEDPVHKMLLDRDPVEGEGLASQPTISRFENSASAKNLFRMGEELARGVVKRHRKRLRGRARRITIDLDSTADLAHGDQQLALFNGHYENTCYLPLLGFVSFDDEPDQYLCTALLRPGNSPDKRGAVGVLKRVIALLRAGFAKATIRGRLDAGFASPEIFDYLDAEGVEYAVAMPKNSVLERRAKRSLTCRHHSPSLIHGGRSPPASALSSRSNPTLHLSLGRPHHSIRVGAVRHAPQERRLQRLTSRFDRALGCYSSNDRCKYTPELNPACPMNNAG